MAKIYYSEKIQSNINKEKSSGGEVWRELGTGFQESIPSGVTQDVLYSYSSELWQHMWSAIS